MQDPRHAPGWRGRPPYYGDLQNDNDSADRLERVAVIGCGLLAAASLTIAAYVWIYDGLEAVLS